MGFLNKLSSKILNHNDRLIYEDRSRKISLMLKRGWNEYRNKKINNMPLTFIKNNNLDSALQISTYTLAGFKEPQNLFKKYLTENEKIINPKISSYSTNNQLFFQYESNSQDRYWLYACTSIDGVVAFITYNCSLKLKVNDEIAEAKEIFKSIKFQ